MLLSISQAYNSMFSFLDSYWEERKIDDLAVLLGSMDRSLWSDNMPIDGSITVDWITIFKGEDIMREEIDIEKCYEGMLLLLQQEGKSMGLKLENVILDIKQAHENKKSVLWKRWIDCCIAESSR